MSVFLYSISENTFCIKLYKRKVEHFVYQNQLTDIELFINKKGLQIVKFTALSAGYRGFQ